MLRGEVSFYDLTTLPLLQTSPLWLDMMRETAVYSTATGEQPTDEEGVRHQSDG